MSVSVPRLVAIESPFGQQVGKPGDKDGQLAALLGALEAVEEMKVPGSVKHLPLEWTGTATDAPEPPPIAGYLVRHPFQLMKFFSRDVPPEYSSRSR